MTVRAAITWGLRGVLAVCLIVVVAVLGTWLGDREPPYVPERGEIIPARARSNTQISVVYYGKRNRLCDGIVTRTMIERCDGKVHSWVPSPSIASTQVGSPDGALRRELMLPSNLRPAENEDEMLVCYRVSTCYFCNPLQRLVWPICVAAPELRFTVLP